LVRVPYLVGAAGLALATAVVVLWGFSRAADRTEVLVVRAPVAAGTPIAPTALSTQLRLASGPASAWRRLP